LDGIRLAVSRGAFTANGALGANIFGALVNFEESETLVVFSLSCAKTYEVELEAFFV